MYAIFVEDRATGENYKRIAGENTPIKQRIVETIGTTACGNAILKEELFDAADSYSDDDFLRAAFKRMRWEIYPILKYNEPIEFDPEKDDAETFDFEAMNENNKYCYAQLLLRFNEDKDKFVEEDCGDRIRIDVEPEDYPPIAEKNAE